jgi:hypothetical protein
MTEHSNSSLSDSSEEDTLDGELSPYSCANCRRGHRKCDRKLPKCTECVGKRKKCAYEVPQKRGPKGKAKNLYQPYPSVNTAAIPQLGMPSNLVPGIFSDAQLMAQHMSPAHDRERELIRRYLVTQHLDLEFENITSYIPVVPPFKIKEILAYIRDNVCTGKTDFNPETPPPSNAELALVFAIEGMNFC